MQMALLLSHPDSIFLMLSICAGQPLLRKAGLEQGKAWPLWYTASCSVDSLPIPLRTLQLQLPAILEVGKGLTSGATAGRAETSGS